MRGYLLLAGAMLLAAAAVLAVYPVSPRGVDTCGSVLFAGPGTVRPTGIHRFDISTARECNGARSDRGLVALLVALAGAGLVGGGALSGRRGQTSST